MENITHVSLLAAAITVNARYAAYTFYQDRKGQPLTKEEMEEIGTGVQNEIGKLTKEIAMVLSSD